MKAGEFCREFDTERVDVLQDVFNDTLVRIWKRQPEDFVRAAVLEADGTMVEATGQCKEGTDINSNSHWGYHPLMLSLVNTGERLYLVNRPGSRPSHELAAATFDKSIALCLRAVFKSVRLRVDTDLFQTAISTGGMPPA